MCPRQILGTRLDISAVRLFPDALPQKNKRVLTMVDGCFADGVSVATGCSMGHRTLRPADEGKIAATFIDTRNGRAMRLFALPICARATAAARGAASRWHVYLDTYRQLPAEDMFGNQEVRLNFDVDAVIGKNGSRAVCARCCEEILNQRKVVRAGQKLCRSCAGKSYWSWKL